MEKLARKITDSFIINKVIGEEVREVYVYGFNLVLEVGLNLIICLVFSSVIRMLPEAVMFLAVFQLLRSYSGGVHLNSYLACSVLSNIVVFTILLAAKFITIPLAINMAVFLISAFVIFMIGPVEDINRPLTPEEKKNFRKKSGYALIFISLIYMLLYQFRCERLLVVLMYTLILMIAVQISGKIRLHFHKSSN